MNVRIIPPLLTLAIKSRELKVFRAQIEKILEDEVIDHHGSSQETHMPGSYPKSRVPILPELTDKYGTPILVLCARFCFTTACRILLSRGFDPFVAGKDGRTALQVAEEGGCNEIAKIFREATASIPKSEVLFSGDWAVESEPEIAETDENLINQIRVQERLVTSRSRAVATLSASLALDGVDDFHVDLPTREKAEQKAEFVPVVPEQAPNVIEAPSHVRVDFSGKDLSGSCFANADLTRADFRRAILADVDFRGANLSYANLENAVLTRANLSGCNMTGLCGSNADFSGADLHMADLTKAKFVHGVWIGARLKDAVLTHVTMHHVDLSKTDLSLAVVNNSSFYRANLVDASFRSVRGKLSVFRYCKADGVDFTDASLKNASFESASLQGASFSNADLYGSDFEAADCIRADFSHIRGARTKFRAANLSYANFNGADVARGDFSDADLTNADFTDSEIDDASFKGAKGLDFDFL